MKRILIMCVLLAGMAGCSEQSKPAPEVNDEVVIIVDGLAYSERFYFEYGKEEGAYSTLLDSQPFTYSSTDPQEIIGDVQERGDTIVIPLNADWMIVGYRFSPLATSDFIVQKGDTVLVSRDTAKVYSRAQPQISVLNRECRPMDVGYRAAYLDRFGSWEGLTIQETGNNYFILWELYDYDPARGMDAWYDLNERHHRDVVAELESEKVWLDSLNAAGMFSEHAYRYFKERNGWTIRNRALFGYRQSVDEAMADSLLLADYDRQRYDDDVYGFYRRYVSSLAGSSFFARTVQVSQGVSWDWEYAYDKIQKDTLLKGTGLHESFLMRTLEGMLQDYPKHKSKKYVDMAIAAADSVFAATISERFKDSYAEDQMVENEVLLMSPDGKKTSLSRLLSEMKGKVVYIDFWASWCRPCCAEMEPAALLRESMKGDDVEFVYLSTDEDHEKMCCALDKLGLKGCRVYRILNPKAARFMYEYNISLIPRYMIVDRKGNIVDDNAPRPSSEEINSRIKDILGM